MSQENVEVVRRLYESKPFGLHVEELIDAGDEVVAVLRAEEVESAHAVPWTLADGEVTGFQRFDDRQRALGVAGLSE